MKKVLVLLVIATLTSSVVGCGCCRRLRRPFTRGAYCGTTAVANPSYVAPVVAPAPAPQVIMPQPAPQVIVPQAPQVIVPQATYPTQCVPCQPCCEPCQPYCDPCSAPVDPCCETYGYGASTGYGASPNYQAYPTSTPVYDSGWNSSSNCCGGGGMPPGPIGSIPTSIPAAIGSGDPGPIPPGP